MVAGVCCLVEDSFVNASECCPEKDCLLHSLARMACAAGARDGWRGRS